MGRLGKPSLPSKWSSSLPSSQQECASVYLHLFFALSLQLSLSGACSRNDIAILSKGKQLPSLHVRESGGGSLLSPVLLWNLLHSTHFVLNFVHCCSSQSFLSPLNLAYQGRNRTMFTSSSMNRLWYTLG